ncbi:MAG: 5-oxoprolinase subunit PxpB [Flavobacteriaceae bacterium]
MKEYNLTYKPFGESAILIEWPSKIDESIIQDIIRFEKIVVKNQKVADTVIAYNSLTVLYKHNYFYSLHYKYRKSLERTVEKLKELYDKEKEEVKRKQKTWLIPVSYDPKFGLDLEEIAKEKELSIDEVIQRHSTPSYLIYFLGFQPGFLYLGGLDKQIHMPRRANPRLRIEKGSVGIGGEQTGIYPSSSAGGWNIIGKSPINFFDIAKPQPCFARAGDSIQFQPVNLEAFYKIQDEVKKGMYQLKYDWV